MDVFSFLSRCAAAGAEAVQICENAAVESPATARIDAVKAQTAETGILVELGCRGSRPDHVRRQLEIAERLGVALLRVVLSDQGTEVSRGEAARNIEAVLPEIERAGVVLAIENHFELTPAEIASLVREFDHPNLGVCLDPLNSISRLVGPAETVRELIGLTRTAHVKDARVERAGTGFSVVGVPIGEGIADVRGTLERLSVRDEQIAVHVESWIDRAGSIEETLEIEDRAVRSGIEYIRRIQ
ncbi:MAG: sugar phosphate isomerase/epimerase [Spirochaetaceae bacterium]|nr:MAG: sugar phosphate isomerase/epimerase [Spirochaetaceae bacterium]